ncbi:MAG TPA: hypothetical protein VIK44_05955 [Acetobacterium sp.]
MEDYNFYWMIMVGLLLGITFTVFFFVFLRQAKLLADMFNNTDLLAHWTFDSTEQLEKVEAEYKERKTRNKIMIIVMTFFFVLIGGFFLLFAFDDMEEAGLFFMIFFGTLVLLYIVAFAAPRVMYNRMKKALPEVFVGPYSAWVMGEYTQWKAPMTRITDVNLLHDESGDVVISVNFEILQRYGPQLQVCRIPVPDGKEEEAIKVAKKIASVNNVEYIYSE